MRVRGALLFALGVAACGAGEAPTRLVFAGDVLLSREVAVEIDATGGSPWDSIAPFLAGADLAFANLEGAFGTERECHTGPEVPCFAFSESTFPLLRRSGLDAFSLANNHAADLGSVGRARTQALLDSAGLLGVDFEHSPRFVRLKGRTVAIVAVDLIPGADGAVQQLPSVELAQKLRLARTLADLVVVSIHWGRELQEWPSAEQRAGAQWLVEQGADLVVGHHPHVVQPPECIAGHPVFFSLGNHVFDQRYPATKLGLLADCSLSDSGLRCAEVQTTTRQGSSIPVARDSVGDTPISGCRPRLRSPLVMAGYRIRPEPWHSGVDDEGLVLEGWKEGGLQWRSRRVRVVAMEFGVATGEREKLLLTLERHPSDLDDTVALRPHVYGVSDRGLVAKWRGTALAWPLLDAELAPDGGLCALHRGDSFIRPGPGAAETRTLHYLWTGFGFAASKDSAANAECAVRMRELKVSADGGTIPLPK